MIGSCKNTCMWKLDWQWPANPVRWPILFLIPVKIRLIYTTTENINYVFVLIYKGKNFVYPSEWNKDAWCTCSHCLYTFTYCLCSIPSSISHALPYRRTLQYKSRLALKFYDISHVVSATEFTSTNGSTKDWAVRVCNKNNIMTYCSLTILKMDKSWKSFFSS